MEGGGRTKEEGGEEGFKFGSVLLLKAGGQNPCFRHWAEEEATHQLARSPGSKA